MTLSEQTAADSPDPPELHPSESPGGRRLGRLSLMALGIVFGDIGTSPLYAFRESFRPEYGLTRTADNIYGVVSLILWALILTVSVKYIVFIMRADNRGEGGILALLALLLQLRDRLSPRWRVTLVMTGLVGAALLYGDGVITPAITVLSAVEGLEVVTPSMRHLVVPASVVILVLLFLVQRRGTANIGWVFGPIMLFWFAAIGFLGGMAIWDHPRILTAINPAYGVRLFMHDGRIAFLLLGAVVLAVTGTEALYADMGHFGRRPIRLAWFVVVLPSLMLNYFGQGAIVLDNPHAAENPFFALAPHAMLYVLVALATMAAVIASQALISGAFSLTHQSVQLGYSPRFRIIHTSGEEAGQIYVPALNHILMIGCLAMVLGFGSSAALSAAYGIAVTGTMVITTVLFTELARVKWGWPAWQYISFAVFFLTIDLAFAGSNVLKIESGGWVPLAIAGAIFTLMTTWHTGRKITRALLRDASIPLDTLLSSVEAHHVVRVPGTAVFMTGDPKDAPMVLLHHLKHNKVLHEQTILFTVQVSDVPEVPDADRLTVTRPPLGFWRIVAHYGFMQTPDVPDLLRRAAESGLDAKPLETTFYLGRELILPIGTAKLARWRKKLYAFMTRNALSATAFFGLPPNRVIELGAQLEI